MDGEQYARWVAGFASLSARQVEDSQKRLKQRLTLLGPGDNCVQEDWLLSGMLDYLRRHGLAPHGRIQDFLRTRWGRSYLSAAPTIRAWLEELMAGHAGNTQVRMRVGELVAASLVKRLERQEVTPGPGVVLASVAHAREAIERSFPGYVRANLFYPMLVAPKIPKRDQSWRTTTRPPRTTEAQHQ